MGGKLIGSHNIQYAYYQCKLWVGVFTTLQLTSCPGKYNGEVVSLRANAVK